MTDINLGLLRERVAEAWKNACEGGYEEQLRGYNDLSAVAGDMIAYDDDISELAPGDPDSPSGLNYAVLEVEIAKILKEIM